MITGTITANLLGVIPLQIANDSGELYPLQATVDTGFNGFITLPPSVIKALAVLPYDWAETFLADGTKVGTNLYLVKVIWDGETKIISAEEADTDPLVGMELLLNSIVTFDVRNGGIVTIQKRT